MKKKIVIPFLLGLIFLLVNSKIYANYEFIATSSAQQKIEVYTLPYPGLLPDTPFYPLKAFRDRIIDFLISDPVKKAEFYILTADKHLNAGIYLFNSGKKELSETTISKGENYLENSLGKIREAQKQGLDIKETVQKAVASVKVHQYYISELEKQSAKELKGKFADLKIRADTFAKEVDSFVSK